MQTDDAYQLVFETHPEAMWICAHDGAMLAVNQAALTLYGYQREAFLSLQLDDIQPGSQTLEISDGFSLHFDSRHHPLRVETKVRALTFAGQDARLVTLRELVDETSWQLALDAAGIGIWELELTTGRLNWDKRSHEIHGLSPQDFDGRVETWQELLHPDALEQVQALDIASLGLSPFHNQHRVLLADASERIIESYGQLLYRESLPHKVVGIHFDVTARQRAEESLRSRDQLLERLTRQVPGMIYQHRVYPDGRSYMPYCSDGIRTLIGVTPEQVREDANFLLGYIHPDDRHMFRSSIKDAMGRMGPRKLAYRFCIKGEIKWAYGESTPELQDDGSILWHGYIVDITRQRLLEEALRANEERLRLAKAIGGMGVWDKDLRSGRVLWDEQMFSLFGLDPETPSDQLEALSHEQIHPDDRAAVKAHYSRVLKQGHDSSEVCRLQSAEGSLRYLESHIGLIRSEDGTPVRMLGMTRDVTARQLAEVELQRSQAGLEEANRALEATILQLKDLAAKAESASLAKSQFLANISHELRTPLNGVIGMSQLLLESLNDPELRSYAEVIYSSGRTLLSQINDILDFSRSEAGKLELESVGFSLPELLRELEHLLSYRIRKQGLSLEIHKPGIPVNICGDPGRLRQVLLNLLDNAVKFTPSGRVLLEIQHEFLADAKVSLTFTVSDDGIGIPAAKLDQIFEPFTQADGSTTRQYGGTGLGLSICRQLVELMGGELHCQSTEGQGSAFSFALKFALPVKAGS